VGVVAAGQAGADVEELADARLGGQVVADPGPRVRVLPLKSVACDYLTPGEARSPGIAWPR
jgi:hypothetical protein